MNADLPESPRRPAGVVILAALVVLGIALMVVACGIGSTVGDGGPASTGGGGTGTSATELSGSSTTAVEPTSSDTQTTTEPVVTTSTTASDGGSTTSTAPTAVGRVFTVNAYFARDEKIAAASRTTAITRGAGAAAMRLLLQGPTEVERKNGMTSAIPEGTTLLGVDIKNGIATVDLTKEYGSGGGSLSMMTRLAQVVFTLTQFPTVHGVEFMLDGKPINVLGGEGIIIDHPMTRADYEDLSPAILVESPTLGATVSSPLRVTGTANVFEAVFRINIVDGGGLIIADERVQASSGTGTRGTFDVTIKYPAGHAGQGSLIVFENSAKDGSPVNVVETPVVLK